MQAATWRAHLDQRQVLQRDAAQADRARHVAWLRVAGALRWVRRCVAAALARAAAAGTPVPLLLRALLRVFGVGVILLDGSLALVLSGHKLWVCRIEREGQEADAADPVGAEVGALLCAGKQLAHGVAGRGVARREASDQGWEPQTGLLRSKTPAQGTNTHPVGSQLPLVELPRKLVRHWGRRGPAEAAAALWAGLRRPRAAATACAVLYEGQTQLQLAADSLKGTKVRLDGAFGLRGLVKCGG